MIDKFKNFVFGVSVNWQGKLGVILVTSSFIIFLLLEIARLMGILTNAYIGLITYLLLPFLFVVGLLLIPWGWYKYKKASGRSTSQLLRERFSEKETEGSRYGARLFRLIAALTLINVVFMGFAAQQMTSFMDQARFCGTACHSVMNPEWITYQVSPHARVECVECHVGEGIGAAVDAKLNGVWQMISVTFNLYEKPIPTPVRNLRPARETCEKCHWPEKFYGRRLKTIVHYQEDESSTPRFSTLNLKIDAGHSATQSGIHWHIARSNEVRYASVDDERKEMIWVEVRRTDGEYHRYENRTLSGQSESGFSNIRVMDCVDCHNRATHIYEDPSDAVDLRIRNGRMDRSLPYLKREALRALRGDFGDKKDGLKGIRNSLAGFYSRQYPELTPEKQSLLDSTVAVVREIYERNIHPGMNITWGSYPSYIGHRGRRGCFRCHNENLVDRDGQIIAIDCTLCHSILANDEAQPFKYVLPPDPDDRNYEMHKYLRQEFLQSGDY